MKKKYFDNVDTKYRYYVFDYSIGQYLLTIDTVDNKYRIDSFNIHGQCSTLDKEWKKITKATINKALKDDYYTINRYIREYFSNDNRYIGDNEKRLLYKSNSYDDCILFLANYAREKHNYTANTDFDYYKKYLIDKSKELENIKEEQIIKRKFIYYMGVINKEPTYQIIEDTKETYFSIKIKDYDGQIIDLALGYNIINDYEKYKIGNSIGVKVEKLEIGLNKVVSVEWIHERNHNMVVEKFDRSNIKADRNFIKDLIDNGALDDKEELKTKKEYEDAVDYWIDHYFDDYSDEEIKKKIKEKDSDIIQKNESDEEVSI